MDAGPYDGLAKEDLPAQLCAFTQGVTRIWAGHRPGHYDLAGSAVGTPDLQVLNGTARPVHGADIAVIVTNGRVTEPAVAFAKQQRLHVTDRHTLAAHP